jgi:hypothetical protein
MSREDLMIGVIRDMFHFLSQSDLTLEDVSKRVGPIAHDPGGRMPLELRSILPGVSAASLARYPNSNLPYILDLTPAPDARPTAAKLKTFLGKYRRARTDMGRPWKLVFHPSVDEESCAIAVIADLELGAPDLESAPITRVAFRRDSVIDAENPPSKDVP